MVKIAEFSNQLRLLQIATQSRHKTEVRYFASCELRAGCRKLSESLEINSESLRNSSEPEVLNDGWLASL
jgi:hypothetical protein